MLLWRKVALCYGEKLCYVGRVYHAMAGYCVGLWRVVVLCYGAWLFRVMEESCVV